jgi:hypothetical protein
MGPKADEIFNESAPDVGQEHSSSTGDGDFCEYLGGRGMNGEENNETK